MMITEHKEKKCTALEHSRCHCDLRGLSLTQMVHAEVKHVRIDFTIPINVFCLDI